MGSLRGYIADAVARLRGAPTLATLRRHGLRAGADVHIGPHCVIDLPHAHLIEIGDRVTLAPGVYLLAHDASTKRALGYTRVARIRVGRDVFSARARWSCRGWRSATARSSAPAAS